jgi:trehalose-6-phosphate hydrolase
MLPNNWRSKFGGNAWRWHASEQYYLHLFAPEQADLNWENPAVRAELKKVCEFWADRGVDGLRLDVINLISKDQISRMTHGDGRRFYTDGPRVHEYLQEMSRDVFTPRNLMTVGEMSSTSLEHCQQYASLDGRELSMTFNFHHLKVDYPGGEKWTKARPDYVALKTLFSHWQQGMHNGRGTRCSGVTTISRASCRALAMKANTASRPRKCWRWCCTACRARRISTRAKSWA